MWLVDEVKKNLPNELDFLMEARNGDKLAEMFKHLKFLKVSRLIFLNFMVSAPLLLAKPSLYCPVGAENVLRVQHTSAAHHGVL